LRVARFAVVAAAALAAGCPKVQWAPTPDLRRDNPRRQMAAIARIVEQEDRSRIPELIALLDSEDTGVRFAAASALHRLTGEDFGVYYARTDEEWARRIEMWHTWWDTEGRRRHGDGAAPPGRGDQQP
jgi:HEAT repeat protein